MNGIGCLRETLRRVLLAVTTVLLAGAGSVHAQPTTCRGDCDMDWAVSSEDFRQVIRTVFDPDAFASCPSADPSGSGEVNAAKLLQIIVNRFSFPTGCPGAPSDWIPLARLGGGPRQEVGVTSLGNTVYVIGGFTDTGAIVPRVEAYDIATNTWSLLADLPRALHHTGAGAADRYVFSIGGLAERTFIPVSDVYCYDPDRDQWTEIVPLPTPRGALAVAELDGRLYAIGGSGVGGSVTRHDVYDPIANEWTELAPLPTPRNHIAAAAIDGKVYAVGGRGGGIESTAELDCYDPATDTWEVLSPMPTARSGHAAAAVDGRLVVIGGEVNDEHPLGVFPQVEMYDPATDEWISLTPMPVPRHGIGATTIDGLIYVPGGGPRAGFAATAHVDALAIHW